MFEGKVNPFSQRFREQLHDMWLKVEFLWRHAQAVASASVRAPQDGGAGNAEFDARITSSTLPGTDAVWKYSWKEVTAADSVGTNTDFVDLSGGRTGSSNAINLLEQCNTGLLGYGNAIALSGGDFYLTTSPFTGSKFKPVTDNTVVRMRLKYRPTCGSARYEFSAPYWIEPGCDP